MTENTNLKCLLCGQHIMSDIENVDGIHKNQNVSVTINMIDIFDHIKKLESEIKVLLDKVAENEFRY